LIVKELDYVRTKDGRMGTIMLEYTVPDVAYEIDYDGQEETEVVKPADIIESYG
jgi:hypothetical protein